MAQGPGSYVRHKARQGLAYPGHTGRQTVVPSHSKDLKTGTVEAIKKQLGLKGEK